MTSSLMAESNRPSCICIDRVASVLAELLCIGRFCRSYDSDRFLPYKYCITTSLLVNILIFLKKLTFLANFWLSDK